MSPRTRLPALLAALMLWPAMALGQVPNVRTILDVPGTNAQARLGQVVATVGDLDGDGLPEYAIAAPLAGPLQSDSTGLVLVYRGGRELDAAPWLTLRGEKRGGQFGAIVGPGGDYNGDGFGDLLVTAPSYPYTARTEGTGRVYIFLGGPTADAVPDRVFTPAKIIDNGYQSICYGFGFAAATLGDVDKDGFPDYVVGCNSAAGSATGAAIVLCSGEGYRLATDRFFRNPSGGAPRIAAVGDVNLDLIPDFAIVDPIMRNNLPPPRLILVSGAIRSQLSPLSYGLNQSEGFGTTLVSGDLNADGVPDLLIGNPSRTGPGRMYLWFSQGYASNTLIPVYSPRATGVDSFGASATAGDLDGDGWPELVVGAPGDRTGGAGAGAVHLVRRDRYGLTTIPQTLFGLPGDALGSQVAAPGNLDESGGVELLMSAPRRSGANAGAGYAAVVTLSLHRLDEPTGGADWIAGGMAPVEWFGATPARVTLSLDDGRTWRVLAANAGGGEWNRILVPVPDSVTARALVRVSPATATSFDVPAQSAGSFSIVRSAPGWQSATRGVPDRDGHAPGERWGAAVAGPEDLDGDGALDRVIGAPFADGAHRNAGRVEIAWGDGSMTWSREGDAAAAGLGSALAIGDLNSDGKRDLLVGAPRASGRGPGEGATWLLLGPLRAPTALRYDGPGEQAGYGAAVAVLRDWNRDGRNDWAVAAPGHRGTPGAGVGRVDLYLGSNPPRTTPNLVLRAPAGTREFGRSLAALPDWNGDGASDLAVSASWDGGLTEVLVYFGGTGADDRPDVLIRGAAPGDLFGAALADAGDLNGDGVSELAVGAPLAEGANGRTGRVYLFTGGPRPSRSLTRFVEGVTAGERFGAALAAAGDVNRDGRGDLAIGAPEFESGGALTGAVRVLLGGGDLATDLEWRGLASGGAFGAALSASPPATPAAASLLIAAAPLDGPGRVRLLEAPRYAIDSPAEGARWFAGAESAVRWRGAEPAEVSLSTDGGQQWTVVAPSAGGAAVNELVLTVPAVATGAARVRLRPASAGVPGECVGDAVAIRAGGTLESLTLDLVPEGVKLAWRAEPGLGPQGWRGYRIYRREPGGEARPVGPELVRASEVVLDEHRRGATYALRAVSGLGEEQELGSIELPAPPPGLRAWPVPAAGRTVVLAMDPPLNDRGGVPRDFVMRVFDLTGRQVRFLASGEQETRVGQVRIEWDRRRDGGAEAAPGVYFVRAEIRSRGWSAERRVVLTR